jgi:hypothetical protein
MAQNESINIWEKIFGEIFAKFFAKSWITVGNGSVFGPLQVDYRRWPSDDRDISGLHLYILNVEPLIEQCRDRNLVEDALDEIGDAHPYRAQPATSVVDAGLLVAGKL